MVTTLVALVALAGAGELQLTEVGAAPRAVVRYAPAVDSSQTVRLEMDVDMEMSMSGMAVPAMDVPTVFYELSTTVRRVDAGAITYGYTVTAAGASGEGKVAEALDKELGEVVGTEAELVLDARGQVSESTAVTEAGGDPTQQMDSALGKLSLVMPKDAIGVGAVWKLEEDVVEGGISVHQVSTWTLAEVRKDGALAIDVRVSQRAEPQEMTNERGQTSKLLAFSSTAEGRTVVHPARMVPLEAEMASTTEMKAESEMAGAAMAVQTKMSQRTRLREK